MFSTCFVLLVEKMMETLSVTAYAVPAPPRGELFKVAGRFLITSETLATGLTACALSVKPCRACQIPPFVAARHLPPERGKSFLKGRAKSTAGYFLIIPNTLVMNFTAWLSLWESWRGSA